MNQQQLDNDPITIFISLKNFIFLTQVNSIQPHDILPDDIIPDSRPPVYTLLQSVTQSPTAPSNKLTNNPSSP